MAGLFGIAPEVLEGIDIAFLGGEDVDDGGEVVDEDPGAASEAFGMSGVEVKFFEDFFFDAVGDTCDMGGGGTGADDEKVGAGVGDMAEVKLDDIEAFYILHSLDDSGVEGC